MTTKEEEGKKILDSLLDTATATGLCGFLEKSKANYSQYLLHSYAEFYGDETLDLKTKQLLVITALITQKGVFPELRNHLQACKNVGLTKQEVTAVVTHLTLYVGFPTVFNVFEILNEVYKST